jgi:hypothetical protein
MTITADPRSSYRAGDHIPNRLVSGEQNIEQDGASSLSQIDIRDTGMQFAKGRAPENELQDGQLGQAQIAVIAGLRGSSSTPVNLPRSRLNTNMLSVTVDADFARMSGGDRLGQAFFQRGRNVADETGQVGHAQVPGIRFCCGRAICLPSPVRPDVRAPNETKGALEVLSRSA